VARRIVYCDTATCVRLVQQGRIAAFSSDMSALQYIANQQPCDTQVVGDPFGPGKPSAGLSCRAAGTRCSAC
jgi:hypothetical protein